MIKPSPPIKPIPPTKPNEILPAEYHTFDLEEGRGYTLDEIAVEIKSRGGDPASATIGYFRDYYDGYQATEVCWTTEDRPNPNYELEQAKYRLLLEGHRLAMKQYDQQLADYKAQERTYLEWFHQNELEKLRKG